MPKIETYSSQRSTQYKRSSADDFVDTRGLQQIAQNMEEISARFKQVKETEDKLKAAQIIAEGRQKWMIELDNRQKAIELENLDYRGFTETFNKDYTQWADETVNQIGGKLGDELRIDLINMQSTFMGGAMDFEARRRADDLVKSYNQVVNTLSTPIQTAQTIGELDAARIGTSDATSKMPPMLKAKADAKLNIDYANRSFELLNDPDQIEAILNDTLSGNELTPEENDRLVNKAMSETNRIRVDSKQKLDSEIAASYALAKSGNLSPDWISNIIDYARTSGESDKPEFREKVEQIRRVDALSREVWKMSPEQYSISISTFKQALEAEQNPSKRASLQSEIALYAEMWDEKNKALTKDFAGVALSKNMEVQDFYNRYQAIVAAGAGDETVKKAFDRYVLEIDNYADKVKYNGYIKYLPEQQIDNISSGFKQVLLKPNGVIEASNLIDSYQNLYGSKFKSVMRQLRERDESFSALSLIPRIEMNTNVRLPQNVKNSIIESISVPMIDPKAYAGIDIYKTPNTDQAKIQQALNAAKMPEESTDRRVAYESLAKLFASKGVELSKAQREAYNIAYGDISVRNKIVYPKSKDRTISRIVAGANSKLMAIAGDIKPIAGAEQFEIDTINKNPTGYIDFTTSQNGDGLMAVWRSFGDGMEPVLNKNTGQPIVFKWDDAEAAGLGFKDTYDLPFNPVTGGY